MKYNNLIKYGRNTQSIILTLLAMTKTLDMTNKIRKAVKGAVSKLGQKRRALYLEMTSYLIGNIVAMLISMKAKKRKKLKKIL